MQQNNQPLIITAIIAAVALILGLAWIFSRNDASTPKPAVEQKYEYGILPELTEARRQVGALIGALIEESKEIIGGLQASTQRLLLAAEACDIAAFDAEKPIIEDLAIRSQELSAEIEKMGSQADFLILTETIRQETLKGLGASQGILACQA